MLLCGLPTPNACSSHSKSPFGVSLLLSGVLLRCESLWARSTLGGTVSHRILKMDIHSTSSRICCRNRWLEVIWRRGEWDQQYQHTRNNYANSIFFFPSQDFHLMNYWPKLVERVKYLYSKTLTVGFLRLVVRLRWTLHQKMIKWFI